MPELPEVETIRQDLRKKILYKKIFAFDIKKSSAIKNGLEKIEKELVEASVTDIERRGKLLIFKLSRPNSYLLIHLKMTGQLIYRIHGKIIAGGHNLPHELGSLPNKHTAVVFNFSDGSQLFFNDQRRFGYVKLVNGKQKDEAESKFGIEALDKKLTVKKFKEILARRSGNIKAVLLDQSAIAGIGNIYADEVCFCAGVRPDRKVKSLQEKEKEKIARCIPRVLNLAVKHRGTTFSDYLDSEGKKGNFTRFLKVYEREGEKCLRCKSKVIEKKRIAGRGTSFCSNCQK